ncbi:hypothetical protein AX17_007387 [Amanita inopinata Kibby_2008]|nr:hypothetical protein AX17_007387 [Amanita inopinata Kibby_2008]
MQDFSEEHTNLLLSKEWLVKVDNERSTPYLFKFYSSSVDLSCYFMVTDTKSVWAEGKASSIVNTALTDKVIRQYCPAPKDEDFWRTGNLELLSQVHTLGAMTDITFRVVDSNFSDLAFFLECDTFQWRWETNFLGHRHSSEIISKQIIFPLISMSHMAFSSPDPLNEMSDPDIEKAVDRLGRTARRSVDTHIRNVLSKPRMATAIRRMTAIFNFVSELPAIFSTAEKPNLEGEARIKPSRPKTPIKRRTASPEAASRSHQSPLQEKKRIQEVPVDSATESEPDASFIEGKGLVRTDAASRSRSPPSKSSSSKKDSGVQSSNRILSDTESMAVEAPASGPERPAKKHKGATLTDEGEDSEPEHRKHMSQPRGGNGTSGVKRGARQPIKRGGRRF